MSYRVELPVFSGPMDLLLHLVKQQEVDIHEVRIADILDQYLSHLKVLEALDLGDLGDFLVMASALMEIKSREILPREGVEITEELNPKDDLIRRLLEYKRYRDISRRLDRLANRRSQQLEASVPMSGIEKVPEESEPMLDLGDVEIWNLTEAFAKLLEETGLRDSEMTVNVDRRDVQHYAAVVLDKCRDRPDVEFRSLFDQGGGRMEMIGVFIAVLEMMKQGVLKAHQDDSTENIVVAYVGDPSLTADEILAGGHRVDGTDDSEPEPGAETLDAEEPEPLEIEVETPAERPADAPGAEAEAEH